MPFITSGKTLSRLMARPMPRLMAIALVYAACSTGAVGQSAGEATTILPGDARFDTPDFDDYQAVYASSFAKTGGFTLQARKTGDGKKLTLIDIIPMSEQVIVAQRVIDLTTHKLEFGAGPYFAWGPEYVVSQSDGETYNWTRVPIGEGEPTQISGKIEHNGYISEMFSPTLAALMPMKVGAIFHIPEASPRIGDDDSAYVSSDLNEYEVLRKEKLELGSGLSCECWVLEKRAGNGMTDHLWVAREAPFVFRRMRDIGGKREFTSDLLSFQPLGQ